MSDISGMPALPERELPGQSDAAPDDAQADEFATMLAALWMPFTLQPAPENKMIAPPDTAAPEVAAVSAAPLVNTAPALMNAAPALMNAAPALMNAASLPDELGRAATLKPANNQPATIDAAPQTNIESAATFKTGAVRLSSLARLVTAGQAATDNASPSVITVAQPLRAEPVRQSSESEPKLTAQTFLTRAETPLSALAPPPSVTFEFDDQPVMTAIKTAPAPASVAADAPGISPNAGPNVNVAELEIQLPADRSVNIESALASPLTPGNVRQAVSLSLPQTAGPAPVSDQFAAHQTTMPDREQSVDDQQLMQAPTMPETVEQIAADVEMPVQSPIAPRPLPPAPEVQAERSGLIRRVIEQTAPAPPPSKPAPLPSNPAVVTAAPITDNVISRAALPLTPVSAESGNINFNSRHREPRETSTATTQSRRDVLLPDEVTNETAPPARLPRVALKPLVAEFHAAESDAPPASATESSAPEAVSPVTVQAHRAAQSVEKNASAETPAVISQTAGQVITVAERMTPRETRAISLSLNPKDLGRLEVRITRDDEGRVSAQFTAERDVTRHALREGLTELRQTLERAGLPVDRLEIRTATPDAGPFTGFAHGQSPPHTYEQPASHRFATADPAGDEVVNQERAPHQPEPGRRLLSRRA